jgi:hypothetical protein
MISILKLASIHQKIKIKHTSKLKHSILFNFFPFRSRFEKAHIFRYFNYSVMLLWVYWGVDITVFSSSTSNCNKRRNVNDKRHFSSWIEIIHLKCLTPINIIDECKIIKADNWGSAYFPFTQMHTGASGRGGGKVWKIWS